MKSAKKNARPKRRRRPNRDASSPANVATVETALRLHKAGDYKNAKETYCTILASDPTNADAWHLLGMLLHATGHQDGALECLENATAILPNRADMLSNLGLVYRSLGRSKESLTVLHRATQIDPRSLTNRNNLGTVLMEAGRLEEAESHFQAATELDPASTDAAMNLGNVWQRQGRLKDAETIYRNYLDQDSQNPHLLSNLGESLRRQCKWSDATRYLRQALQLNPSLIEAQLNLGRTLMNSQQNDLAAEHFRRLIQQNPAHPKAHHFLGKTLSNLSDITGATTSLKRSLELQPDDPYTQTSLAFVYMKAGDHANAAAHLRQALELDPMMSEPHSCLLYLLSGDSSIEPKPLFDEHRQWGKKHGQRERIGLHANVRKKDRRLRIGYVSPDFRDHALASYFRPVLESHHPESAEVYCYAEVAVPDTTTALLQESADHWRFTTGMSDRQVAQRIATDQIDILVDLAGHTANNRLLVFAHKPAPIQITWMGYPNTTGLDSIDYRLTCDIQNPVGEATYHVEELVRLPGTSFCFSAPQTAPTIKPLPAQKNGFITFGSLHRPFKISQETRQRWARLLHALPTSRLIAFNTSFTDESESGLKESLAKSGIDPQRIDVRRASASDNYLQTYDEIDIALDVSPWAGGTTTLEAIWMGVPVIAHYGNRRSSRSTAAIVAAIGHPEWIARSEDQYIEIMQTVANDIPQLCHHRSHLRRESQQTIFNAQRFTTNLEQVYRDLWHRWCDQP